MEINLPRLNPGDRLLAAHINEPNAALERLTIRVGEGSGIGCSEGPTGVSYWVIPRTVQFWAKITGHASGVAGSSGPYAWTEQVANANGTWQDGFQSGTTTVQPAFESTGNAAVPTGKVVLLTFSEAAQAWGFLYSTCS